MKSIYKFILCFTIFRINYTISARTGSVSNPNNAAEIYKFWKEQDKNFHLGTQKDVVLFLGNTGSGKSATALFVTGANLTSKETFKGSEEYYISDEGAKIGRQSLKSHTLIPDLMIDHKSGVAYYDCPGFMDTRSPAHDLTIAYFLNKLMTYAESFKLVFVVSHSSVKANEQRSDFSTLVKNVVKLIKDIEKYSDGIALIVTKVDDKKNDTMIIKNIAHFLDEVQKSLNADNDVPDLSEEEQKLNNDSITFIKALLHNEGNSFSRIGIFRRTNESGLLSEMEIFQNERIQLETMINENIKYVRKESDDFGFIISSDSNNFVVQLTDKIVKDEFASDVANISHEIEEFYLQKEDLISDVTELHDKLKLGVDLFTKIRTEDPRLFLKDIVSATSVLGIGVSIDTIEPILKHLEHVDFLIKVVDQKITNPIQLANKFKNVVDRLTDAQKWYGFLIEMEKELLKSNFQNDDMKNVASKLKSSLDRLVIGEKELKPIEDTELKNFLKDAYTDIYSNVKTLNINSFQLKALKNILYEFSSDHLQTTCSTNQLNMTAKGHVVKTSDVIKDPCFFKAKYITIIALNTLIFDANIDKIGQQAQILIIAPTWDIFGDRKIILDGENGKNHSSAVARNGRGGDGYSGNGEHGKPGLPGGPGGNFIGIGSKFINEQFLTILLNGGNGGAGQDGGNGTLAIEGKHPPIPKYNCFTDLKKFWDKEGFDYTYDSQWSGRSYLFIYTVFGKNGTKAGDGGGAGPIGKGGISGGNETQNGYTYKILVLKSQNDQYSAGQCELDITKTIDYGKNDAGKNGIDNYNTHGMMDANAPIEFYHPSFAVNEYKSFAREQSVGSSRQTQMIHFLNKVTNNTGVKAQYKTLDFIDEFITIENQYFQLRGKIDFIPFLESLLDRIDEFARTNTDEMHLIEYKKVLAYLYAAILSKINGIKNKVNENTVFNLEPFLVVAEHHIGELEESIAKNNIIIVRNDYKSSLDKKVQSANEFIKTQIMPKINDIIQKVDEKIDALITESIKKQKDTTEAIIEKKRRRRELEDQLRLRKVLGPIKILASTASFLGPAGAAAGSAIGGGTMLIESLALDENSAKGIDKVGSLISNDFKTSMARMTEVFKQKPELIKQKIYDIDRHLKDYLADDADTAKPDVSEADIKEIKDKMKQSKAEMVKLNERLVERINGGDNDVPTDLMRKYEEEEKNLKNLSGDAKAKLEKQKSQLTNEEAATKNKLDKQLRGISHVQAVVNIGDVSLQFYNQIRNDDAKLQIVGDAIASLQNDLKILKIHEGKIYDVLIPQIRTIENTVNEINKNLKGKSHVELDIKKWNIRSTLSEVRLLFGQMTKDFSVHDCLKHSIDMLDEGLATLIDVYDRIDSYSDNAKLATYIENIVSGNTDETVTEFSDTELSDAVVKLKQLIRSNIVLDEYEMAMHAFKMHYFPFADTFTLKFHLPDSLQMNDTSSIIKDASGQIAGLREKVKLSQSLFNEYDESMHLNVDFDGGIGSQPPFYIWKYHEYKHQIKSLLQGEEITIKADVIHGVNQNAIKFNRIGIHFKLIDAILQRKLDDELRNFQINMTMVGTNYYRCNNRYYRIPLDRNLVIDFAFENKAGGTSKDPNAIYTKIHENAPFLSPYVMWTIRLTGDFRKLEKFVGQTADLELIGSGQYLKHGTFANKICNSQLDKYYSFDKTISNVNILI